MINKQDLLDKLNSGTGILNFFTDEFSPVSEYKLKNRYGISYLELWYPNGKSIMDNPDYITDYSEELLDIEFKSILIAGLGIGAQAYVCQDFAQVDVVEVDENVININNQIGRLNNNVNIINDDIFTFSTDKKYDVIVLDIWWLAPVERISDKLIEKLLPNLNDGGFIYIPINKGVFEDKRITYK